MEEANPAVQAFFKQLLASRLETSEHLKLLKARLEAWYIQLNDDQELSSLLRELGENTAQVQSAITALQSPGAPANLVHLSSLEDNHERYAWVKATIKSNCLYDLSDMTLRFSSGTHILESHALRRLQEGQLVDQVLEGMERGEFLTELPVLLPDLRYEVTVVVGSQQVSNSLQYGT